MMRRKLPGFSHRMDLIHMFCEAALHPHRLLLMSTFLVLGYGGMFGMAQVEMSYAGTLEGTVHYVGPEPSPKVLKVTKDQGHCGTEVRIQTVHLHDAHGALSDAVVSVEGINSEEADEVEKIERLVLNTRCAFAPRISIARQGQEMEIRNQDPILHNTHIKHGERTFLNIAQVPGGKSIMKRLKRQGLYAFRCDKHVFMEGYLHVFPHPYYAQTNEVGKFRIADIPPGKHHIQVWHETLGSLEKVVKIPEVGIINLNFTYP